MVGWWQKERRRIAVEQPADLVVHYLPEHLASIPNSWGVCYVDESG